MSEIASNSIQVFPGCKRDAGQYSSRLLIDQNLTRFNRLNFLYDTLDESEDNWKTNGNSIVGYKANNYIDFCLGGYYFHVTDSDWLTTINNMLTESDPNKSLYASVELQKIEVDSSINDVWELIGTDVNNKYNGLTFSETEPTSSGAANRKMISMQLIIPGNTSGLNIANSIFNPKFTAFQQSNNSATEAQKYYQFGNCLPYFISSTEFANGQFSDKNKIWIDNIYFVPHVYAYNLRTKKTNKQVEWVPLGAVYKPLGQY